MTEQFNLDSLIDEVASKGTDQSQAKKGPEKLPEGTCFLRIFAYLELGTHITEHAGVKKPKNRIRVGMEVSGKNYPAVQTDSGPRARTIWLKELTMSQDDRSGGFKLFQQLRKGGDAKHFVQLLGDRAAFMGEIKHSECGKYANLVMDTIRPAYTEAFDPATEETTRTPINVTPLRTAPLVFVRKFASPAMWDSLYIPGEYPAKTDAEGNVTKAAASKNVWQEKILAAEDAKELEIFQYASGTISRETSQAVDDAVGGVDEVPPMDDYQDDDIPF